MLLLHLFHTIRQYLRVNLSYFDLLHIDCCTLTGMYSRKNNAEMLLVDTMSIVDDFCQNTMIVQKGMKLILHYLIKQQGPIYFFMFVIEL